MKNSCLFLVTVMILGWMGFVPAQAEHKYPPPSEKKAESGKVVPATAIKAILVAQTSDEGIGKGCAANLASVEMLVRNLPDFKPETDLVVLKEKDATTSKFIKALKDIQVRNSETLFVYFAGHGAFEDDNENRWDPSGGHVLQMPDGKLRRWELLQWLNFKGAKLSVLITDTCNVPLPGTFWFDKEDPKFKTPAIQPEEKEKPGEVRRRWGESDLEYWTRRMETYRPWDRAPYVLPTQDPSLLASFKKGPGPTNFQDLLRLHEGLVDISGTSQGEFGWYNPDGGWFTIGLLQALGEDLVPNRIMREFLGEKISEPCLWVPFLQRASERATDVFCTRKGLVLEKVKPTETNARSVLEKLKEQNNQRSKIFQLKVIHSDK